MRYLFLFSLLFLSFFQSYGQGFVVSGSVHSTSENTGTQDSGLPGAAVRLKSATDTSGNGTYSTVTNLSGQFQLEGVTPGNYLLSISFMGFDPFSKEVQIQGEEMELGKIMLEEKAIALKEVQVISKVLLGRQMGDTTEFNASAFTAAPNANAENLVEKMPGINMVDGKLQAQGEEVQEIMVDGKRFFEGDVDAALKNLPADIIANIQIIDRKSEQAQFSGFDDGERIKTINIVTKKNRRQGVFGQASVGYGTDNKYLAGASISFFDHDRRITLTGISNNINTSGYAIGETPGGGLDRNSDGNRTTKKIRLNYNNKWGEKLEVSGNYTFDHRTDINQRFVFRDYILPSDSGQVYNEKRRSTNTINSHRLRMRLEYDINKSNELVIKPRISLGENASKSYFFGRTVNDFNPINQTETNSNATNENLEFENELHFRHRFAKRGRTFSTSLEASYGNDYGETYRVADNIFFNRDIPAERLDQYRDQGSRGLSWEANASFTEPLGDSARIQLEYKIRNRLDDSDRRTYDLRDDVGEFLQLDTLLSNTFKSDYLTQEVEVGYQYNIQKLKVEVETEFQQANLQNKQQFPMPYQMERTFHSLLPSAELEYRFTDAKDLRLDYRARTKAPSLSDLQDVIDNSNPLQLSTGNPDLKQSYQNILSLRYKSFNQETNQVFYARLEGSLTKNTIGRSTLMATAPTTLRQGIVLEPGSQLSRPVNLDEGNWDIGAHVNYGKPIELLKSNLSLNASANYSRSPGMVNDLVNFSNRKDFSTRASLSSNISKKIDFNVSTRSGFTIVENTLRPHLNNNYFNQSTRLKGSLIFWDGFIFRTELRHRLNTGLSSGFDNSYLLWNLSLGKTLFNNERGEISLSVNDLLKQSKNIDRNVTEVYIEESESNVLQQFFMLSFTYSIRHFGT